MHFNICNQSSEQDILGNRKMFFKLRRKGKEDQCAGILENELFGSLKSVLNLQVTLNYPDEKIYNHLTTISFFSRL